MANVKVIGGSVVNTAGVPLPSKTVTLKNDDTNTTLTTTTTNADGEWEFPPRDETVRYRAEAAFGGSSAQVVVRKPASAEFDHLYANLSFRSAAAATVALGGTLAVGGAMAVGGNLAMTGTSATIELGSTSGVNTPIIDFHSSGIVQDYDSRIIGSGGAAGIGLGRLDLMAATVATSGALSVGGALDMTATGAHIELGSTTVVNTPLLDFHSSGNANDYDSRIIASGGAAGNGLGLLSIEANSISMAGALTLPVGSVGAPSLAFAGDPDTGLYAIGANNAAVALGGIKTIDLGGSTATTAFTTTATGKIPVRINGIAAQTADMFQIRNSANTLLFAVEANGQCDILGPANFGGSVGFYGTAPIGGPNTVSGSRGGNAALASLLTTLANMGLFINSTTA